jgi:hypothetical protein
LITVFHVEKNHKTKFYRNKDEPLTPGLYVEVNDVHGFNFYLQSHGVVEPKIKATIKPFPQELGPAIEKSKLDLPNDNHTEEATLSVPKAKQLLRRDLNSSFPTTTPNQKPPSHPIPRNHPSTTPKTATTPSSTSQKIYSPKTRPSWTPTKTGSSKKHTNFAGTQCTPPQPFRMLLQLTMLINSVKEAWCT